MRKGILLLLFAASFAYLVESQVSNPVVETRFGSVKGGFGESRDGRTYYQFLGIPYGKAERFQPPQDPDSWQDIRDGTKFGNMCPQYFPMVTHPDEEEFIGDEDCLNLNIYTPKLPKPNGARVLLPVIVWLHLGGGSIDSGQNYGADYYMDTEVVLVTFDARLEFLGYLNLGSSLASGNQRLKDQVLLLKWIQSNIENFGGDPARVTLIGSEAGAAEAAYHLLSSRSKGLISGVVSHGSSSNAPAMFVRDPIYNAKLFGKQVGCPTDSAEKLHKCLMEKDVKELVLTFHRWVDFFETDFIRFGPSIESIDPNEAFLSENPYTLILEERVSNTVPWIFGASRLYITTPNMFKIILETGTRERLSKNLYQILPLLLDYSYITNKTEVVTKKVLEQYLGGKETVDESNVWEFIRLMTDRHTVQPEAEAMRIYSKYAPGYVYILGHVPDFGTSKLFNYTGAVAGCHGDEVLYQFPWRSHPRIGKDSPDYEFSKSIVQLLASFAENGKPTRIGENVKEWLTYDNNKYVHHLLPSPEQYNPTPTLWTRIAFWNNLRANELKAETQNPELEPF